MHASGGEFPKTLKQRTNLIACEWRSSSWCMRVGEQFLVHAGGGT